MNEVLAEKKKVVKSKKKELKTIDHILGYVFSLWGLANLIIYISSHFAEEERFNKYFTFDGSDENLLQPFRALVASNRFENIMVTAPSLIVGGYFLKQKLGPKRALKYWQVSLLACFTCLWAFGPHTEFLYQYSAR